MKKYLSIALLGFMSLCFISYNANAKLSGTRSKSSVAYRNNYQRTAGGGYHVLELRGGTLWAWGYNGNGQLGIGNTTNQSSPVQVGTGNNWVSIAAGGNHSLALKADGTLWAWGWNVLGQLGIGNTTDQSTPVQVGTGSTWVSIVGGAYHSLALKADGTLWAWGANGNGQLGIGNTLQQNSPVQVGTGSTWVSIAGGEAHSLGLKANGSLWAWGYNGVGQLGIGNTTQQNSPVQVGTGSDWVSIAGGTYHSLALKADGSLWAWGYNGFGQLGIGNTIDQNSPVQVGTGSSWVSMAGGGYHSLALKADGSLWAWGYNANGQLGIGNTIDQNSPVQMGTGSTWVSIAGGYFHSLALKADGSLWAWGANGNGQLGIGNTADENSPVQTSVVLSEIVSVANGGGHTLVLKSDGTVWAWGYNGYGSLGTGNNTNQLEPLQVGTGNTWIAIAAGERQSFGLKADGTLWAWGGNEEGQLGIGNNNNQYSPVQVGADNKWADITAGIHSIGLKADGTVWAWGLNWYGGLGIGNTISQNSPVQVGTDNKWINITAGGYHSLGLRSDGTLWGWGLNGTGQLGLGFFTNQTSPVQIGAVNKWTSTAASDSRTLALQADGSLWAWGGNMSGELGTGNYSDYYTPVRAGLDNDWVSIASGSSHSLGLKPSGTVWTWGGNYDGQLGLGDNANRNSPVQVPGYTGVVKLHMASIAWHSAIVRSTRDQLCLAGSNYNGQIGDGTTNNAYFFTCISVTCPPVTPTITVTKNTADTFCSGTMVIFTATITDGGYGPWYQWYKNGIAVGYNQSNYYDYQLNNMDSIRCVLTSHARCATPAIISSATDTVYVNPSSTPTITVTKNTAHTICSGTPVTFTAAITDGGTSPTYQWYKNGNAVGLNQNTYDDNGLNNMDSVRVELTSNAVCATPTVVSASDTIYVNPMQVPGITCSANAVSCDNVVTGIVPTVTGNGPCINVSYTLTGATTGSGADDASGTYFNPGITFVKYRALNINGAGDSCTFTVIINLPTGLLAGNNVSPESVTYDVVNPADIRYMDCDLISSISPAGGDPLSGNTVFKVTLDNNTQYYNGQPYVKRHYDIEPSNNASTATATITLYAYQFEFDAYNVAANATGQPLLPTGGVDNGNVRITQFHGTGTAPGNYSGSDEMIVPVVSWNNTYNHWVMTFDVTGFSGFYIHTSWGVGALSLKLLDIAARNEGDKNRVDWKTANESAGDKFILERSADGKSFAGIMDIDAQGKGSDYTYWDEKPFNGINYYRIKLIDAANHESYSKVVNATVNGGKGFAITASPNPAQHKVTINVYGTQAGSAYLTLTDVTGKEIQKVQVLNNKAEIDVSPFANGLYMIRYTDDNHTETIRLNKQGQ